MTVKYRELNSKIFLNDYYDIKIYAFQKSIYFVEWKTIIIWTNKFTGERLTWSISIKNF